MDLLSRLFIFSHTEKKVVDKCINPKHFQVLGCINRCHCVFLTCLLLTPTVAT